MSQEFADFTIEQDYTDVPEMSGEFATLPVGDYVFDIVHLEQKASSTGNPGVNVTFQVAPAEAQLTDEARAFAGQKAWNLYSLLPQSAGRIKKLMVACGANLAKFTASEIMNSRIVASITHRKGEAKPDADGNLQEARTFANVVNERPLEATEVSAPTPAKAPPPPVKAATKPATNGAARRA
jgi:hypothetical protein